MHTTPKHTNICINQESCHDVISLSFLFQDYLVNDSGVAVKIVWFLPLWHQLLLQKLRVFGHFLHLPELDC
jgi:predicted DCC family thiol-disulfide oxidoreductase YuxK